MAFLGGTFDANSVEPSAPMEVLPPGKYSAQIIESEMRETRSGGQMLKITMEVVESALAVLAALEDGPRMRTELAATVLVVWMLCRMRELRRKMEREAAVHLVTDTQH